ncbi:hypothetical protein diail_4426 [Diaporthe ilicicola]|nr:hypothetical protein diail_4426 [Diaporthe ilicicola]
MPTRRELHSLRPMDPVSKPAAAINFVLDILGGSHSLQDGQQTLPGSKKQFFRADIKILLPGHGELVAAGDGVSRAGAKHAACLHALAKMHDRGLLALAWPPLTQLTEQEARDGRDGILDVYNYAALYGCIPKISIGLRSHCHMVIIEMPEHDIKTIVRTKGSMPKAEAAAAREFKKQAELYHLKKGADTLVVRDPNAISTHNATEFLIFCRDMCEDLGTFDVKTKITAENAWRGRPVVEGLKLSPELEVITKSKGDTIRIAHLVAALFIIKQRPHLVDEFTAAVRAGNGSYIPKLRPDDVVLSQEVLEEMKALQTFRFQHGPSRARRSAQHDEEVVRHIRHRHILSPSQLAEKSAQLQKQLEDYRTNTDLALLRQTRSEMPMTQYASRVRQIVQDNVYCVIIGATGSGKTTQVPQILLDQAIDSGAGASCNVICTQPRRIAATSVARRVADERAEQLQHTVGYQVRFDSKLPKPNGSILYCTTGILLQQLQHAPDDVFDHVSHLVIDEVHERDTIIDFLLITLKKTMAARAAQGKKIPRIVLMSATIDAEIFAAYFRDSLPSHKSVDCPTLTVPGRTFPVKEYYLENILGAMRNKYGDRKLQLLDADKDTRTYLEVERSGMDAGSVDADASTESVIDWKNQGATAAAEDASTEKDDALVPLGLVATTIAHITKTSEDGAILVFLPGLEEITRLDEMLRLQSPLGVDFKDTERFQILMLHSSIQDSQKTVFDPLPSGCRKIILSTNIAETSVTIPDVRFVVDTGKSREKRYDQTRRITQLQCTWVSKSNAKQRAGRAGRVQDGVYYALFSRSRRESMRAVGLPELLRSDLQEICLDVTMQAFKMPVGEFLAGALEPPPPLAVDTALQNLKALGALTTDEKLTPLGRLLASLPVHPTLGKMIVLGIIFRCLDPMIILGAAAHQRPLFISPLDSRNEVDATKKRFAGASNSDHIALLRAFDTVRLTKVRGSKEVMYNVFKSNFIHAGAFNNIEMTAREIEGILRTAGLIGKPEADGVTTSIQYGGPGLNQNSGSEPVITALLVAGLYPNFAANTKRGFFRTAAERIVHVHRGSVASPRGEGAQFLTFNSLALSTDGNRMNLRDVSPATPLMALLFGGQLSQRGPILELDQWLPMFIKADAADGAEPSARYGDGLAAWQVSRFRATLDTVLASTFDDLAAHTPLDGDGLREELACRLARVLNLEAGLRVPSIREQRRQLRVSPTPEDNRTISRVQWDWNKRPTGPSSSRQGSARPDHRYGSARASTNPGVTSNARHSTARRGHSDTRQPGMTSNARHSATRRGHSDTRKPSMSSKSGHSTGRWGTPYF